MMFSLVRTVSLQLGEELVSNLTIDFEHLRVLAFLGRHRGFSFSVPGDFESQVCSELPRPALHRDSRKPILGSFPDQAFGHGSCQLIEEHLRIIKRNALEYPVDRAFRVHRQPTGIGQLQDVC